MAINDFENVEFDSEYDQQITSTSGKIVSAYLESKNNLDHSVSEAVNSSYDFGYLLGSQDTRNAIIEWVKENRRVFELDEGVEFYRDGFNSQDLIKFIEELGND